MSLKNPIYSVFSFIFFVSIFIIFLIRLQIEFIAYLLLIIYVGAIAVLFLFTLILLDIVRNYKEEEYSRNGKTIIAVLCLFFYIPCVENFFILVSNYPIFYFNIEIDSFFMNSFLFFFTVFDINILHELFSHYIIYIFFCIVLLLVGIIGTALFLRKK